MSQGTGIDLAKGLSIKACTKLLGTQSLGATYNRVKSSSDEAIAPCLHIGKALQLAALRRVNHLLTNTNGLVRFIHRLSTSESVITGRQRSVPLLGSNREVERNG